MFRADRMTATELDKLAREAEADPSAMANFGMLLGFLYLAGELRLAAPSDTDALGRSDGGKTTNGKRPAFSAC